MKTKMQQTHKEQLIELKRRLEITEKKLDYVTDPKLTAALAYEVLGLRARMGYVIDSAKMTI